MIYYILLYEYLIYYCMKLVESDVTRKTALRSKVSSILITYKRI